MITLGPDGLSMDRTHGPAAVTVSAPASDLDLLLWRRVEPGQLGVEGDREVLARFLAWMDLS